MFLIFNLFFNVFNLYIQSRSYIYTHMNYTDQEILDLEPIQDGATGTIVHVDDWGHIHVQWDNGRSLSVIPGEDKFEIK